MGLHAWDGLRRKLAISEPSFSVIIPKPSRSSFDQFERTNGFALPTSYKQFIQEFGPGVLANEFGIRAPGFEVAGPLEKDMAFSMRFDLACFNRFLRTEGAFGEDYVRTYFKDPDIVTRLIYFADSTAGDQFGWDPTCPRLESGELEYNVFVVEREAEEARLVADSFKSFVLDICLATVGSYEPPAVFDPACRFA